MFSSSLVSKLVCMSAGLRKNYSTDFHKIRWKVDTRPATEETIRFGVNPAVDPDQGIVNGIFYNFGPRP